MPRPIVDPNERHTYADWQRLGYQVQRGEHNVGRDERGEFVFAATQVRPRNNAPPDPNAYQGGNSRTRRRARRAEGRAPAPPPAPEVRISFDENTMFEERVRDYVERQQRMQRPFVSPAGQSFSYYYDSTMPAWGTALNPDWVSPYSFARGPGPAPAPSPQQVEEHQAAIAINKAQTDLIKLQLKRPYVPEDDESTKGFKQLCAIERQLKEK